MLLADGVGLRRDERWLLRDIDLAVRAGEHWALLGPNGAGKTTLLRLLGAHEHPTVGTVEVLGARLGRIDVRDLRREVGWLDPAFPAPVSLTVREVVLTGATGTQVPVLRRSVRATEVHRAAGLEELVGVAHLRERRVGTLSAGERGRTLLARALVPAPRLLLLDEPSTGLDLGARETLLAALESLAAQTPALATVLVTHHLEELPRSTTHAALLRDGRLVAAGPAADVLVDGAVGAAFGLPVLVRRQGGRWSAALSRVSQQGAEPRPAP